MKARQLLPVALATAMLAMSTASYAHDDNRRGDRDNGHRVENRHVEREVHREVRVVRRDDYRHDRRPDVRYVHRDVRVVHTGPRYHRGQYLPAQYRSGRYVVVRHQPGLYAPPRGHQWVQVNGDFLLVAVATGLIAHAILH
ncbi:MAG: RcnB family protein [Hydrogenophaga sp.]|uniref:RcnB family protein n=1 Tax=Hydrogenophaga sp. TaxID=1904254 RepID=UPI001E14FF41|nr:RcnB family protein [Hydrogenophaga sp.]MBX3611926.1 RcnB family protein [Hydrogenophaga sp.]